MKKRTPRPSQPSISSFFGGHTGERNEKVVDLTGDDESDSSTIEAIAAIAENESKSKIDGTEYFDLFDSIETRKKKKGRKDNDFILPFNLPMSPAKSDIPPEHNAFNKLLAASKSTGSMGKKMKAVFILYLDMSGKLHPFFTFDVSYLHKPLHSVVEDSNQEDHDNHTHSSSGGFRKEWSCEVTVNHFRWDIFRKEYKELSLVLRTNLPKTVSNVGTETNNLFTTSSGTEPSADKNGPPSSSHGKPLINASLLKSMIQKGVRRRQTKKTMQLTAYLSQFHLQEILRRLPVISVEDVILHPSLPILLWLMIAITKGFQPILSSTNSHEAASHALTYVHQICALVIGDLSRTEWKDCYPETQDIYDRCYSIQPMIDPLPASVPSTSSNNTEHTSSNTILAVVPNSTTRTLVASLLLRRGYGGMGGDMEMLEEYAILWARRFQGTVSADDRQTTGITKHPSSWIESYISPLFLKELYGSGSLCGLGGLTWGAQLLHSFEYVGKQGDDVKSRGHDDTQVLSSCNSETISFSESILNGNLHSVLERELMHLVAIIESPESDMGMNVDQILHRRMPLLEVSLETDDVIIEGLDFHCDWSMVEAIFEKSGESLRDLWKHDIGLVAYMTDSIKTSVGGVVNEREALISAIKSSIWYFRSSINVHKLWTIHPEEMKVYQETLVAQLKKKEILSKVWKIICPEVQGYCTNKLQSAIRQISATHQKNRNDKHHVSRNSTK